MQKLEESLALAEERIERSSRDFDAHFVAGSILAAMADWERELIWRWSTELNEGEIASQNAIRIEHLARAEEHFRAAIDINPSDTDSYTGLFDVVEQQSLERRGEALEILEQGRRRDPFNVAYNRRVAFRVAARGRYHEAMEILNRFKSLPQVPSEIWFTQTEIGGPGLSPGSDLSQG